MKKKLILIILLLSISTITVYAANNFIFDTAKLSFATNSKKESVVSNFNKNYNLSYSIEGNNTELEEEIKNLTKKTTYLLFGEPNNTD